MSNLKKPIEAAIEAVKKSEKITRKELSYLSRSLLIYVPETNDIGMVNRLINVLTPVNRRATILYFQHFLYWESEKDKDDVFQRFGKMRSGDKYIAKKLTEIEQWLKDEANDIWSWSDDNIDVEKKPADLFSPLSRALENAVNGTEESKTKLAALPLSAKMIMEAVTKSGVNMLDLFEAIDDINRDDYKVEEVKAA